MPAEHPPAKAKTPPSNRPAVAGADDPEKTVYVGEYTRKDGTKVRRRASAPRCAGSNRNKNKNDDNEEEEVNSALKRASAQTQLWREHARASRTRGSSRETEEGPRRVRHFVVNF